MDQQKVFFSYSRADAKDFALKLAKDLLKAGADIWIDQLNIRGGENYNKAIENALTASTCVLFIASEKSVISNYVLDEVHYAIEEGKVVIPIILHECRLPFRLRGLQRIFFTENYENGFDKLVKSLSLNQEQKVEPNQYTDLNNFNANSIIEEAQLNALDIDSNKEQLHWEEANIIHSINSYRKYLDEHSTGKHSQDALLEISKILDQEKTNQQEEALWQKAVEENTIQSYNNYLIKTKVGKYRSYATELINQENVEVNEKTNILLNQENEEKYKKLYSLLIKIILPCILVIGLVWFYINNKDRTLSKGSSNDTTKMRNEDSTTSSESENTMFFKEYTR